MELFNEVISIAVFILVPIYVVFSYLVYRNSKKGIVDDISYPRALKMSRSFNLSTKGMLALLITFCTLRGYVLLALVSCALLVFLVAKDFIDIYDDEDEDDSFPDDFY